jgi:hypothetical protein
MCGIPAMGSTVAPGGCGAAGGRRPPQPVVYCPAKPLIGNWQDRDCTSGAVKGAHHRK